ncbi:hypothetical protein V6N13_126951 [Hibiscus sabdariffa]|uniref:Peroxidase n=1 Tax=Hibiscus sabdariffa TaxID=183260 RepID=A0ABR2RDX9_9ROSI
MARFINVVLVLLLSLGFCLLPETASAQLRRNYYAKTCPNVESIVRNAVTQKFRQTFVTVPATIRLFFHDYFVQVLSRTPFSSFFSNVEDVMLQSGGPTYAVELGRLDGLSSTAASVNGKLPQPSFDLNQLNSMFAANGLSQTDMISLSAAHSVGFSHCSKFSNRIYNFRRQNPVDPTLNQAYATQMQHMCPRNVDPRIAINMDPNTPRTFDNVYFKNLQQGKGLFTSDQVLFTDQRSQSLVNAWANSSNAFNDAFVTSITKLGRVGVKTGRDGNIRIRCDTFN